MMVPDKGVILHDAATNTNNHKDGNSLALRGLRLTFPTHTLLQHPPPRPRFSGGIYTLLQHPPPRPRFALLPRPKRGRGQSRGYPGKAVSGFIPIHWTVGVSPLGEGQTGRGR